MGSETEIKWLDTPEEHDYPAAESYLNLIYDPQTAAGALAAQGSLDTDDSAKPD